MKLRGRGYNAFTLIELILVILLISILMGLSVPFFRRTFSDLVLRNTSLNMAKMINYISEMAIIEKMDYKLNLDLDNGRYWITRRGYGGEGASYNKIKGRYGKVFSLPRGIGFACDKKEIFFYPDGHSDKAKIKIFGQKTQEAHILEVKGFGDEVKINVRR